jgi:Zn-dependent M28 family amino/carboxypeptidase
MTKLWIASALLCAGCASQAPVASTQAEPPTDHSGGLMTTGGLMAHIKALSSDEFEGRAPGSPGEEKTVAYLEAQFKQLGLAPGNPDGTYIQKVPLAGFTSVPTASLRIGGRPIALTQTKDFIGVSRRYQPLVTVKDSPLVFVGYGVVAPEYGWDDYKGLDVKGKTVVMLINDPPSPGLFKDKAMTYYGRWTYKYEIASEKGAAAVIIIHETGPAGYPFEVVTGSWGRENFDLQTADGNATRVAVESWVSLDKAREMLAASGEDFDKLKAAAATKEFKPVSLKGTASFTVRNTLRKIDSRNVAAKVVGAEKPDEYLVYTAHWDHLGRDPKLKGDQIFNGAIDNASGTAALLELAKAYAKAKPRRSVLFLSVTAEEKGLLGAKYYASQPLYPLARTLANINMDGVNQWGKTRDLVVVGLGNSTLDDTLATAAKAQNRVITGDAEPEKGFFYRSDQFELAKAGVPALYTDAGIDFIGKPAGYSQKTREEYTNNDYHKVSDEMKPNWDLNGALDDLKLLFETGWAVSQGGKWPEWKPGTEFKALREETLRQAGSAK